MSRYINWLLLFGIAMLPGIGTAQTSCPWLNNATAAGVLNGSVSLKMQRTADNESVCLFQYQQGSTMYTLQIVVHDITSTSENPRQKNLVAGHMQSRSRELATKQYCVLSILRAYMGSR